MAARRSKSKWEHVRHCAQVKHALVHGRWSSVLRAALHDNEAALRDATAELEAAEDALAAADESLRRMQLRHVSHGRMQESKRQ